MTNTADRSAGPSEEQPVETGRAIAPRSDEERRVWEVLEHARQNVKAVAKREMEVETVTSDILNFRLR